MEYEMKRPDLLHELVGEFLTRDEGQGRDVVDRLFRIKLGALAARAVEHIDEMRLDVEEAELEYGEKPDRPRADNEGVSGVDCRRHGRPPFWCFRAIYARELHARRRRRAACRRTSARRR